MHPHFVVTTFERFIPFYRVPELNSLSQGGTDDVNRPWVATSDCLLHVDCTIHIQDKVWQGDLRANYLHIFRISLLSLFSLQ